MESIIKTKRLRISGMTCISCQNKIEKKLRSTAGIQNARVNYSTGTADITYNPDITSLRDVSAIILKLGYRVMTETERGKPSVGRIVGILFIVVSLYILLQNFGILNLLVPSQLADTGMGYGMLFVIGLITSIHCIAMCGGINLSQCIPHSDVLEEKKSRFAAIGPAFLYNLGRVISYTIIGFILGFVGLLLGGGSEAGLPAIFQGILKLVAGLFMVIMGINMLGIFPWIRRLQPRMPKICASKIGAERAKNNNPLIVGLLNGLMPCGPLQSMQIVALASGNPFTGAFSMFLFSLGTVPLMLGLGSIISALGKRFTQKVMNVGAVLVVVLGLAMLSQGGSLSGFLSPDLLFMIILALCVVGVVSSIPFRNSSYKIITTSVALGVAAVLIASGGLLNLEPVVKANAEGTTAASNIQIEEGMQVINSTLSSGRYPNITVQAGTPVKWVIDAPKGSINGCNNRLFIQDYGIEYTFKAGENVIEFTPEKTGTVRYSCWMGMIRGNITVIEAGSDTQASNNTSQTGNENEATSPVPAGYNIPNDIVAIAKKTFDEEYDVEIQEVTIELSEQGFSPAIIVVQKGLDVKWNTINKLANASEGTQLLVPAFATQLDLFEKDNLLYFSPADDFDFSTGDNAFYGYVKVVEDSANADIESIKAEVGAFETLIWPPDTFQADDGAACH